VYARPLPHPLLGRRDAGHEEAANEEESYAMNIEVPDDDLLSAVRGVISAELRDFNTNTPFKVMIRAAITAELKAFIADGRASEIVSAELAKLTAAIARDVASASELRKLIKRQVSQSVLAIDAQFALPSEGEPPNV
jgi:hypothetical protein